MLNIYFKKLVNYKLLKKIFHILALSKINSFQQCLNKRRHILTCYVSNIFEIHLTAFYFPIIIIWFQFSPLVLSQGQLWPSEDIWQHLEMFLVVTTRGMVLLESVRWGPQGLLISYSAGTASMRTCLAQDSTCDEAENPASSRSIASSR